MSSPSKLHLLLKAFPPEFVERVHNDEDVKRAFNFFHQDLLSSNTSLEMLIPILQSLHKCKDYYWEQHLTEKNNVHKPLWDAVHQYVEVVSVRDTTGEEWLCYEDGFAFRSVLVVRAPAIPSDTTSKSDETSELVVQYLQHHSKHTFTQQLNLRYNDLQCQVGAGDLYFAPDNCNSTLSKFVHTFLTLLHISPDLYAELSQDMLLLTFLYVFCPSNIFFAPNLLQ